MTRVRLLVAVALMIGFDAAAGELRSFEENRGRAGTIVKVYSDPDGNYGATIKSPGRPTVRVSPQISIPPPRLGWVSSDLLRIDYGSALGADVKSLFYSVRRNRVDGPHEFVKAIDPVDELILCAGEDVHVQRLFAGGDSRLPVELNDLSRAGLKWFVVSSDGWFKKGTLPITYMIEPSRRGEERWVTREVKMPRRRPDRLRT